MKRASATVAGAVSVASDSTEDYNAPYEDRRQFAHPQAMTKQRAPPPATVPGAVRATDDYNMRTKDPRQRAHPQATGKPQAPPPATSPGAVNATDDNNMGTKDHRQRTHLNELSVAAERKMAQRPQNLQGTGERSTAEEKKLWEDPRSQEGTNYAPSHIDPGLSKSTFRNPNHQRGKARNRSTNTPMNQPTGNSTIQFEDKEKEHQHQWLDQQWQDQQCQNYLHQQQQGDKDDEHHIYTNRGLVNAGDIGGNNLAVAKAINQDDDNFLPAAIEYDPDAKPPLYKNRRIRMYLWAASLVLCITMVGAGVVFVVMNNNKAPAGYAETFSPTRSPTSILEVTYRDFFAKRVGYSVYTPGTPLYNAAEWIIDYDQQGLSNNAPNLMQRYLMALFYYLTTQNRQLQWRSCNPVTHDKEEDWELVHNCTYEKLIRTDNNDAFGQEDISAMSWLSPAHECEWAGVVCDDMQVVRSIELWGQNVTGALPTELAAMESLQSIALPYNEMEGTIPTEYAGMKNLISLELHGNALTGGIPEEFWEANALQLLNFAENMLSGTISTKIGQLTNLKGLHLSENSFTGTFPSEIGNLGYLAFMRIDQNTLSGSIPSELGFCIRLAEIWTQKNTWTGSLPSELGNLVAMTDLRFFSSTIGGTIPEELYNLQQLSRLELYDMMLTGTLSTRIGQLSNIVDLRLRRNSLSGTIPTEMANLKQAILVWIHLNQFQDSVPSELCSNRGVQLDFLNADCGPESLPANPCQCCTSCCDRLTELCLIQS